MDIESHATSHKPEARLKEHRFSLKLKFSLDLANNNVWIHLPYQIPNCVGLQVIYFDMVDDGTMEPVLTDGSQLLLYSSLADYCSFTYDYLADVQDTRDIFVLQTQQVIGWTSAGRRAVGGAYPLGMPMEEKEIIGFNSPQMIQRFSLGVNNIAQSLQPHTNPYTLNIRLKLYSK